jgi:hypothetical protein
VSLGLGSVVATALERAPWLMVIGRHKGVVFLGVGMMLALNYWVAIVRPRYMECAPDDVCHIDSPTMRFSRCLFWVSVGIYVAAVAVNYAALWWAR